MTPRFARSLAAVATLVVAPAIAWAHGNVTPQAVDAADLPELGEEEWLYENPYRLENAGETVWRKAIAIGASAYNQNCARCHGLEAVSGGLAPDLRYLEANEFGDEWYIERYVNGYTQNGITKMPAFGDLLGQEVGWAIRTYVETRPDDGALDAHSAELAAIRDDLSEKAEVIGNSGDVEALAGDIESHRAKLAAISAEIGTASGASVADSPVSQARAVLEPSPEGVKQAAEILSVGLSAAR